MIVSPQLEGWGEYLSIRGRFLMTLKKWATLSSGVLLAFLGHGGWVPCAPARLASLEETSEPRAQSLLSAAPREALLFIRAPSLKRLIEKLKKSPLWNLKEHPQVKEVLRDLEAELMKAFREAPNQPPGALRTNLDPLLSLEGECLLVVGSLERVAAKLSQALAMGQSPDLKPEDVSVAVLVDAGPASAVVRESLEKVFAYAETQGAKRETSEFQGG